MDCGDTIWALCSWWTIWSWCNSPNSRRQKQPGLLVALGSWSVTARRLYQRYCGLSYACRDTFRVDFDVYKNCTQWHQSAQEKERRQLFVENRYTKYPYLGLPRSHLYVAYSAHEKLTLTKTLRKVEAVIKKASVVLGRATHSMQGINSNGMLYSRMQCVWCLEDQMNKIQLHMVMGILWRKCQRKQDGNCSSYIVMMRIHHMQSVKGI